MINGRSRLLAITGALTILVISSACSGQQGEPTVASTSSSAAESASPSPSVTTSPRSSSSGARSSTTQSTSSSVPLPAIMPDLVGKPLDEAEAALKPLNVKIKTVYLISPQPVGTVTEQDPVAGADFAQSVTLTVSTAPAAVPDVTQKTFGAAQDALTKLGFTVKENPVSTRSWRTVWWWRRTRRPAPPTPARSP